VSLVCGEDRPLLAAIERLINKRIEQRTVAGFEAGSSFHAPARQAEPQRHQRRGCRTATATPAGSAARATAAAPSPRQRAAIATARPDVAVSGAVRHLGPQSWLRVARARHRARVNGGFPAAD